MNDYPTLASAAAMNRKRKPVIDGRTIVTGHAWFDRFRGIPVGDLYVAIRLKHSGDFLYWWFYLGKGEAWREVKWKDLGCNQQLAIVKEIVVDRYRYWMPIRETDRVPWSDELMALAVLGG